MNCSQIKEQLPALLYGDLDPAEASRLRAHVDECPACRQQYAALASVREMLDAVPAPKTNVDVGAIYHRVALGQVQRARRWRRLAVACAAVAAVLLLAIGLPLELRVENHQLTIRWGQPPARPQPVISDGPASPMLVRALQRFDADEEERQLLRQLVVALKRDADDREAQQQENSARTQAALALLKQQMDVRWSETQQDVRALYLYASKGNDR
jgi:hypothetical protein